VQKTRKKFRERGGGDSKGNDTAFPSKKILWCLKKKTGIGGEKKKTVRGGRLVAEDMRPTRRGWGGVNLNLKETGGEKRGTHYIKTHEKRGGGRKK